MRYCFVLLWLLATIGCSSAKKLGSEEVQSEFTEASSAAAETMAFVDYIRQGRATENYARGHAESLRRRIEQQIEELGKAKTEPEFAAQIRRCQRDLDQLRDQVNEIATALNRDQPLADIASRVEQIRDDLHNAQARR
jgi:hypothetical protein